LLAAGFSDTGSGEALIVNEVSRRNDGEVPDLEVDRLG
jgi:hypothetical protein